jgi:hypothetical protein
MRNVPVADATGPKPAFSIIDQMLRRSSPVANPQVIPKIRRGASDRGLL